MTRPSIGLPEGQPPFPLSLWGETGLNREGGSPSKAAKHPCQGEGRAKRRETRNHQEKLNEFFNPTSHPAATGGGNQGIE